METTFKQTRTDFIDSLQDMESYRKPITQKPSATSKVAQYTEREMREYNSISQPQQLCSERRVL